MGVHKYNVIKTGANIHGAYFMGAYRFKVVYYNYQEINCLNWIIGA